MPLSPEEELEARTLATALIDDEVAAFGGTRDEGWERVVAKRLPLIRLMLDASWRDRTHAGAMAVVPEEVSINSPAAVPLLPMLQVLLENNLSRKGVFQLEPRRSREAEHLAFGEDEEIAAPSQRTWNLETEDVLGQLRVVYGRGELGITEMELVMWILGQWREGLDHIAFGLRQCAEAFGVAWSGQRGRLLKGGLRRIGATHFEGDVSVKGSKVRHSDDFGIFSRVRITERDEAVEEKGPSVRIWLSPAMIEQLRAHQHVRIEWAILRVGLQTPLARRMYVFLESQQGVDEGRTYSVAIDHRLASTLGSRLNNPHRFRTYLRDAGQQIISADPRYLAIDVVHGGRRGQYSLVVHRTTYEEARTGRRRRCVELATRSKWLAPSA